MKQGLGDAETLLHAPGKTVDCVVNAIADADEIEHLVAAFLAYLTGNAQPALSGKILVRGAH